MEKTTVYLTTEQKAWLARAAEAEGRSEARLIREGIEAVTARHRTAEAAAGLGVATTLGRGETTDQRGKLVDESLRRPRWVTRDEFVRRLLAHSADSGLRAELRDLAPGTTDDGDLG